MMARLIVDNVASSSPSNNSRNSNNNATINNNNTNRNNKSGGGNNKKFTTEALRYPEKILGCAPTSILPEYLFSEKNGSGGGGKQLLDSFSGKPLYPETNDGHSTLPPLSRLAVEVREAIDSDPMYGENNVL